MRIYHNPVLTTRNRVIDTGVCLQPVARVRIIYIKIAAFIADTIMEYVHISMFL